MILKLKQNCNHSSCNWDWEWQGGSYEGIGFKSSLLCISIAQGLVSRLLVMSFKLSGMDVKFYTVKLKHSTGAKRMKSTVWTRRGLAGQCCTVASKANHYSKNLQAALGSGKEMATIRASSVFTTDPLLLTCWHHHETPFPLIYTVTHTFSWPLGGKKSVELSAEGGSLNLEAITILWNLSSIGRSCYFWNTLHLPSCLTKTKNHVGRM